MKFLFSGENARLKTMNQVLTDAARKRTERIQQLEDQARKRTERIEQLEDQAHRAIERVGELEQEIAEKDRELAVVREAAEQRAHLLNEKDRELAVVREALTKHALRIQELERTLGNIAQRGDSGAQPECGEPHVVEATETAASEAI